MDENIREEILQENKMGTMPVGRLLFSMAVPMMVSMLFQALYNVVDSIFVAKLSQDAMNAVSLAFPLAGFCIVSGSVFQALGTPFYSLIVSVCRQICVLLPVAYLLSLTGRLELVWWSFPIAELVSLTLSAIFLRRTLRAAGERLSQK